MQNKTYACPKARRRATAALGRACPAPLPRRPPPPEPERPPINPAVNTELPRPSASPTHPRSHPRYSHIAPLARAAPRKPIPLPAPRRPAAACPGARRPHGTSAGPTPQRPAAHGGAGPTAQRSQCGRGKAAALHAGRCACAAVVPDGKRSPGGGGAGQGRTGGLHGAGSGACLPVGGIYSTDNDKKPLLLPVSIAL